MKPTPRHHVTHLDRSLMALLNERARLTGGESSAGEGCHVHFEDLLRRSPGPLSADALRAIFEAVERGCHEAAQERES